jgi:hypothetical protein
MERTQCLHAVLYHNGKVKTIHLRVVCSKVQKLSKKMSEQNEIDRKLSNLGGHFDFQQSIYYLMTCH